MGVILLTLDTSCNKTAEKTTAVQPPLAEKVAKELVTHGHKRIDNYYWLNERDNAKVIDYLNAENAYTKEMLKHTEGLQTKLYDEIIGRIKQDDETVPYLENGYYYYTRYEQGKEYPIYCRKKGKLEAAEEILLNVNQMAEGYAYFEVGGVSVSPNNKIVAYGVDTVSRRQYTIYFKNLETGELYTDVIANTTGGATWANDNMTVFYSRKDETTLRPYLVFKHALGADTQKDEKVFEETDETFSCGVGKTKSKKYIIIGSYSTLTTEFLILNANSPNEDFSVFYPRERKLEYYIDHSGDKFYIRTNLDAKNFRLMETSENNTLKENWKEVIAHREDVLLENMEVFNQFLVLEERKNGLAQLRVISQKDKKDHYVDFGEEAYTAWIDVNPEFESQTLRFGYSSLTTPTSTFDYNMVSKEKVLKKQQEVVGDFNPENYKTERIYATATDGTKVPISLVYRKDMKKAEGNPLLLYGYGSYGNSTDPYFNVSRLSLLDRGVVFAIAHIRGGQEMGRDWYENGKLLKKKNTFTDFIDCGKFLIEQKYTSSNQMTALGASAGGLLIGAVINMEPALFKAVVAGVPFVDVVTTMLDESIPLTTGEFDEWGNPKEKEYYDYMLSYSPYDNVEAKAYPAMLVTTGLHDSQVQYFEPAKWVAKLRTLKTDDNLLLIDIDMETGHGGASGRFKRHKNTALEYAFLLDQLGIKE